MNDDYKKGFAEGYNKAIEESGILNTLKKLTCDRCGSDKYTLTLVTIEKFGNPKKLYWLCEDCINGLTQYLAKHNDRR